MIPFSKYALCVLLCFAAVRADDSEEFPFVKDEIIVQTDALPELLPHGSRVAVVVTPFRLQDSLLHHRNFTETLEPGHNGLPGFAAMAHHQMKETLLHRLKGVEVVPLAAGECAMTSDYDAVKDIVAPLVQPSGDCLELLRSRQISYLFYVPAFVVDNGVRMRVILSPNSMLGNAVVYSSPRLRLQFSLYDVSASQHVQSVSAIRVIRSRGSDREVDLLGFYRDLFAYFPLDHSLSKARSQRIRQQHQGVELSMGTWSLSAENGALVSYDHSRDYDSEGRSWTLRYVHGAWNVSLSWAQSTIEPFFDVDAFSMLGWWNPVVAKWGGRFGVHGGPNLAVASPDSALQSEERSLGFGFEVGAHVDWYIGRGFTVGARVGKVWHSVELDGTDYSYTGPYLSGSVGWGPRFDWFR